MTDLRELQSLFWRAVRYDPAPDEAIEACVSNECLDATGRLAIYRRMYWVRQVSGLGEGFSHLRAILGLEAFTKLATRYIRRHPSREFALEHFGRHLPAFLAEEGAPAWQVDLATLERRRTEILLAPDPTEVAAVSAIDPARFGDSRFIFSPAIALLDIDAAALEAFDAVAALDEPTDEPLGWVPTREGERARVAIDRPRHGVGHRPLPADEGEALALALQGASIETLCQEILAVTDAADPTRRIFEILRPWFQHRWIARIDPIPSV